MEKLFKRLNDNSTVAMYTGLIFELVNKGEVLNVDKIMNFYFQMSGVDKTLLSDKNIGMLEGLESILNDDELVSFEGKSKKYKKYFLMMLNHLNQHRFLCGINAEYKSSDDSIKVLSLTK